MADIAVLLVIKKIGLAVATETLQIARPFFEKKSLLVAELPTDLRLIRNELELIHPFLKEISGKDQKREVIQVWIGQVRRLAYDMEDIVDQFIYVVGEHNPKGSWWDYMKKIVKKPHSLFSLEDIANEVQRINKELRQLSESRDRWTKPLDSGTDIPAAGYETAQELYLPGLDNSIKDDELVGTDKNKETLNKLLRSEDQSLQIIAVYGMGGVGKSTLVNNVYRNVAARFEHRAWVSVSQSYKMEDIWKEILKDLGEDKRESDFESLNSAELRVELKKILENKKFLIILDDVWTTEVSYKIVEVLADTGRGSSVIITTRIEEVTSMAKESCKIKVQPLDSYDAWLLFCKKAFPKTEDHVCPPDLYQCGKDIVEKCDGLPLALVAIGSLLSLKAKNSREWKLFYDQLVWELHNNDNLLNRVMKILNLSYKYLPDYLKNCFLCCSMFPEDYLIHRKRLIRFWIAEGFIEQTRACSVEDIAEGYLGDLVRRSMLEVVAKNSYDRIKCVRMHDLVRELAIFQSTKETFSTTYDENHGVTQVGSDTRRVSVHQCSRGIPSSIDTCRLRTFITFDISMALRPWHSSVFSRSKYLAVLDLSGLPIEDIPNSLGELFNLRLLCLNRTNVKELPKSITKLQNLQSLSLDRTNVLTFPQGVSKLKKLRYLRAWQLQDATYRNFVFWKAAVPFKGLWNLNELQTLGAVGATEAFVAKLGNLSQLRSLNICDVKRSHCGQLCNSLSKMHQLSVLMIKACNEDELLQLDKLVFPNPILKKLDVYGRLSEESFNSPFLRDHGNALLQMELSYSQLTENQLSRLFQLSSLTELTLRRTAYTGEQLHFRAEWLPNLKHICLRHLPHVNKICIDNGALVSLQFLLICDLQKLIDIPIGVGSLKSLRKAYFLDMHLDFQRNARLAESLYNIPTVYLTTRGN